MSNRNRQLAVLLSGVTLLGAITLPLFTAVVWLFWDQFAPQVSGNLQYVFNLGGLSVGERLCGFALTLIGALIQAYGLLGLRITFCEAAIGNPLSERAIRGFRRFAWVVLIMVFIGVIQHTGLIVIFSLSDPAHQGTLEFKLGSNELKSLFMGLLLVFVSHVFAQGKRAKDENETFL